MTTQLETTTNKVETTTATATNNLLTDLKTKAQTTIRMDLEIRAGGFLYFRFAPLQPRLTIPLRNQNLFVSGQQDSYGSSGNNQSSGGNSYGGNRCVDRDWSKNGTELTCYQTVALMIHLTAPLGETNNKTRTAPEETNPTAPVEETSKIPTAPEETNKIPIAREETNKILMVAKVKVKTKAESAYHVLFSTISHATDHLSPIVLVSIAVTVATTSNLRMTIKEILREYRTMWVVW